MKKLFLLLTAFCFLTNSFSAFVVKTMEKKAHEIFITVGKDKTISLQELSVINTKDYQKITGKKLNFFEGLAFKQEQKRLRKGISADGTITNKNILKFTDGDGDPTTGFHFGGFLLGFFLPLLGVGIAYIIGGDEDIRRNRVKWAWFGTGITIAILSAISRLVVV